MNAPDPRPTRRAVIEECAKTLTELSAEMTRAVIAAPSYSGRTIVRRVNKAADELLAILEFVTNLGPEEEEQSAAAIAGAAGFDDAA